MRPGYLPLVWDSFLAAGVLLSLETQLRLSATAVGPGELCLAVWGLSVLFSMLRRSDLVVPRAGWEMLRFWALFGLAMSIGSITAIAIADIHDSSLVLHDVFAYLLLFSITCLMTSSRNVRARLTRVEWLIVIFGSASVLLQAANAWGLFTLPHIDPWYWDRARGWCNNPEQLALLCLLLAVLALHLAECATRWSARLFALACMAITIPFGWTAKSNSYAIVITFAVLLFSGLKAFRWFVEAERRNQAGSIVLSCALLVLPLTFVASAVSSDAANMTKAVANDLFRDPGTTNDDFELRLTLWGEAVDRGVDAMMLGLGPGPHLAIPGVILDGRREENQPVNLQPPKLGIAPNFESHNTLLELFVQGGLLAVVNFLWLSAIALSRTWRAKQDALTTLLCSLAIFGSFQVIFRHPGVWFVMSLALVSYTSRRPKASRFAALAAGAVKHPTLTRLWAAPT